MSNTYQISNLQEVKNKLSKYFFDSSVSDRQILITSYIDTLMRVGAAASPSQAAKMIGGDIGMQRTTVLSYYQGGAK